MSTESQDLLNFVAGLPEGFAYAPIYVKGSKLQSGKVSKGKTPLEKSHHAVLTPADVALQLHRKPDVFRAVGVFTGPRSKGLVILDVDRNLAKLKGRWGESLQGAPVVTSTKANAAKYLRGQRVVGVNPDPRSNDGVLASHPAEAVGDLLPGASTGAGKIEVRTMVSARLDDGQRLLALNEVFIGHRTHQSARYRVGP